MTTCVFPINQPIYQALLDKAASYPVNEPYKTKAYLNAAIVVADIETNLYTSDILIALNVYSGIGKGIREFINQFIKNPHSISGVTVSDNNNSEEDEDEDEDETDDETDDETEDDNGEEFYRKTKQLRLDELICILQTIVKKDPAKAAYLVNHEEFSGITPSYSVSVHNNSIIIN
jgi:hypothetical protein